MSDAWIDVRRGNGRNGGGFVDRVQHGSSVNVARGNAATALRVRLQASAATAKALADQAEKAVQEATDRERAELNAITMDTEDPRDRRIAALEDTVNILHATMFSRVDALNAIVLAMQARQNLADAVAESQAHSATGDRVAASPVPGVQRDVALPPSAAVQAAPAGGQGRPQGSAPVAVPQRPRTAGGVSSPAEVATPAIGTYASAVTNGSSLVSQEVARCKRAANAAQRSADSKELLMFQAQDAFAKGNGAGPTAELVAEVAQLQASAVAASARFAQVVAVRDAFQDIAQRTAQTTARAPASSATRRGARAPPVGRDARENTRGGAVPEGRRNRNGKRGRGISLRAKRSDETWSTYNRYVATVKHAAAALSGTAIPIAAPALVVAPAAMGVPSAAQSAAVAAPASVVAAPAAAVAAPAAVVAAPAAAVPAPAAAVASLVAVAAFPAAAAAPAPAAAAAAPIATSAMSASAVVAWATPTVAQHSVGQHVPRSASVSAAAMATSTALQEPRHTDGPIHGARNMTPRTSARSKYARNDSGANVVYVSDDDGVSATAAISHPSREKIYTQEDMDRAYSRTTTDVAAHRPPLPPRVAASASIESSVPEAISSTATVYSTATGVLTRPPPMPPLNLSSLATDLPVAVARMQTRTSARQDPPPGNA